MKTPRDRTKNRFPLVGLGCYLNPRRLELNMGPSTCLTRTLDGALVMAIEVQPGAHRQGIVGFDTWRDRLSVAVRAPAKDGQANRAVLHVLSHQLNIDEASMSIVAGQTSKMKTVRLTNLSMEDLLGKVEQALGDAP